MKIMRNLCLSVYICSAILLAGCSSPDADAFYRHSWDYQYKTHYDEVRRELGLPENWRDTFSSDEVGGIQDVVDTNYRGESLVALTGNDNGCNLYIIQMDELVLARLETSVAEKGVFFQIPVGKYDVFKDTYFKIRDALPDGPIGISENMFEDAGWTGLISGGEGSEFELTLEFRTFTESLRDHFRFSVDALSESKPLEEVYMSLMNMVDEKYRCLPPAFPLFRH